MPTFNHPHVGSTYYNSRAQDYGRSLENNETLILSLQRELEYIRSKVLGQERVLEKTFIDNESDIDKRKNADKKYEILLIAINRLGKDVVEKIEKETKLIFAEEENLKKFNDLFEKEFKTSIKNNEDDIKNNYDQAIYNRLRKITRY